MGWSSGTDVARPLIKAIKKYVKDTKVKQSLYHELLDAFEASDWDCQGEAMCIDKVFDDVLEERSRRQ